MAKPMNDPNTRLLLITDPPLQMPPICLLRRLPLPLCTNPRSCRRHSSTSFTSKRAHVGPLRCEGILTILQHAGRPQHSASDIMDRQC
jgi:hypothetical protein